MQIGGHYGGEKYKNLYFLAILNFWIFNPLTTTKKSYVNYHGVIPDPTYIF